MRKQYHFRPSEHGLRAWDVDRLIELSKTFVPFELPLDQIKELDQAYWFTGEDTPTCRRIVEHMQLVKEAELKFPIILSSDSGVMDGMHRVAKSLLEGAISITAVKFEQDPEPDYIGIAPDDLPY
jgi:hypothetical protein